MKFSNIALGIALLSIGSMAQAIGGTQIIACRGFDNIALVTVAKHSFPTEFYAGEYVNTRNVNYKDREFRVFGLTNTSKKVVVHGNDGFSNLTLSYDKTKPVKNHPEDDSLKYQGKLVFENSDSKELHQLICYPMNDFN